MLNSAFGLASVFATRGAAAAGGVILSILVARLAGPMGLGQFAVFLGVLGVFSILARRGLDVILIRAVAKAIHVGEATRVTELLRHAALVTLVAGLFLSLPGAGLLAFEFFGSTFSGGPVTFIVCIAPLAVMAIFSGYLKGSGRPWFAPIFEVGGVSLLAASFIIVAIAFGFQPDLNGSAIIFAATAVLLCVISALLITRDLRRRFTPFRLLGESESVRSELRRGQVAFTMIAMSGFVVQAGSFTIVAPFLSDEELGLARAAERLAIVVSFPVLAIEPFISSRVVGLVRTGAPGSLAKLIGKASIVGALISLPALALMILIPETVLAILGADFVDAKHYLRLLAAAHFVLVLLGPFVVVLNMADGEKTLMWVSITSLVAASALYPTLAHLYGAAGFLAGYAIVTVGRAGLIGVLSIRRIIAVDNHKKVIRP